jgi:hypothetical protein
MIDLIKTHWVPISAVLVAVGSELMPFLPTKYNGIFHLVLDLLKVKKA